METETRSVAHFHRFKVKQVRQGSTIRTLKDTFGNELQVCECGEERAVSGELIDKEAEYRIRGQEAMKRKHATRSS